MFENIVGSSINTSPLYHCLAALRYHSFYICSKYMWWNGKTHKQICNVLGNRQKHTNLVDVSVQQSNLKSEGKVVGRFEIFVQATSLLRRYYSVCELSLRLFFNVYFVLRNTFTYLERIAKYMISQQFFVQCR